MAALLQRKSSGGISFVIIRKFITEENVPRNYFVIISARMVEILEISKRRECGKQRTISPLPRESRASSDFLRDSSDFSSEKTPFVMTPFSGPEFSLWGGGP